MRKQLIVFIVGLISLASFAQKNEMKMAEKAIKKSEFTEAVSAITAAEALLTEMNEKQKAEFYFLKGQAYAGKKQYKVAADALNTLIDFEKQIGKKKYSDDAQPILNKMILDVSENAIKLYNDDKDFKNAADNFYLTYVLSPTDTSFLYNAAISAYQAQDFDSSLKYYKELKNVGYTGVSVSYVATNKETNEVENLGSKQNRDLMLRSGSYIKPEEQMSESKAGEIMKNIGYILTQQGRVDEAITAMKEARAADPKDIQLILTEADLYIQLKQMDKFGALMKEAIKLDPTNPSLFFNLGVVNANEGNTEEAIGYYKKAIELKPDYTDAYTNLAIALLKEEQPIIEEMNKNLSNFDKYDALLAKQKAVYKKALPYLEKSAEMKEDIQTVQTLLNMYQVLEMDDKAEKFKAKFDKLRGN